MPPTFTSGVISGWVKVAQERLTSPSRSARGRSPSLVNSPMTATASSANGSPAQWRRRSGPICGIRSGSSSPPSVANPIITAWEKLRGSTPPRVLT